MARTGTGSGASVNITLDVARPTSAGKSTGAAFFCYVYLPSSATGTFTLASIGSSGNSDGFSISLIDTGAITILQNGLVQSTTTVVVSKNAWIPVLVELSTAGAYRVRTNTSDVAPTSNTAYTGTNGVWVGDVPIATGTVVGVFMGRYINSVVSQSMIGLGFAMAAFWTGTLNSSDASALLNSTANPSTINTSNLEGYWSMAPGTATTFATGEDSVHPSRRIYADTTAQFQISGSASDPTITTSSVTSVTLSPSTATPVGNGTQTFTATVNGTGSPSQAVTWSKTGAITISGGVVTYGPATGASQAFSLTATSVQDSSKSVTINGSIPAVSLTISGSSSVTADGLTNTYTVTGATTPTWSVSGGGSINSSTGVYTHPSSGTGTATIICTDSTGATQTKSVSYAPGVSISLDQSAQSVNQGAVVTVNATVTGGSPTTVTWSGSANAYVTGSANQRVFTAPSTPGTYTLTATSVADGTKTASVVFTVPAVVLTFASTASCQTGGTIAIAAASLSGTVSTSITYTTPDGGTYASGTFTPPGGAVSGATYRVIAAGGGTTATCTVTMTSLSVVEVSWTVGTPNLTGVTVRLDNGLTGTYAAAVAMTEVVIGGVHTGVYSANLTRDSSLRGKLSLSDGQGGYSVDYLEAVTSGLSANQGSALNSLYAMIASNKFTNAAFPTPSPLTQADIDSTFVTKIANGVGSTGTAGYLQLPTSVSSGMGTTIRQGDTSPARVATLSDAAGRVIDLTGCTVQYALYTKQTRVNGAIVASTLLFQKAATVLVATQGIVQYQWVAGDTDTAGKYDEEFCVTVTASGKKFTCPGGGTSLVTITPHGG